MLLVTASHSMQFIDTKSITTTNNANIIIIIRRCRHHTHGGRWRTSSSSRSQNYTHTPRHNLESHEANTNSIFWQMRRMSLKNKSQFTSTTEPQKGVHMHAFPPIVIVATELKNIVCSSQQVAEQQQPTQIFVSLT